MTENFNYVIARLWDNDTGQLCCYMLCGGEVQYGNLENANATLQYVLDHKDADDADDTDDTDDTDDYKIYKVVPL